jgi:hypothetical protein
VCDPAEIEAAGGERRTDRAADVRPPLGPVEAGAAEKPPASLGLRQIDAELGQERRAGAGDLAAFLGQNDVPA